MEEIAVIPRRKRKLLKPKKKLHFRASYLETTPNLNLKNFASRETVAKFKELIEQEEKKKGYKTD